MELGDPDASGAQPDACNTFHLAPFTLSIAPSQTLQIPNSRAAGDRLDNCNVTDDLEVHNGDCAIRRDRDWLDRRRNEKA